MFFFSAWLLMIFWGILGPEYGLGTISYVRSMLITIILWLVVSPLVGAMASKKVVQWKEAHKARIDYDVEGVPRRRRWFPWQR
jgi:hypothetical protein